MVPHLIKHIEAIESVQRRAIKLVPGLSKLSYPERLRKLKLPTLTYRRIRGDIIQVFKLLHENIGYDNSLPPFFNLSHTQNLRGHSKKLFITGSNKDIRKYSFSQRVTKIWNSLPEEVITANTMVTFEKRLDKFWSNQPVRYDDFKASIII